MGFSRELPVKSSRAVASSTSVLALAVLVTTLSPAPVLATSTVADYKVLKTFGLNDGSDPERRLLQGLDGAFEPAPAI